MAVPIIKPKFSDIKTEIESNGGSTTSTLLNAFTNATGAFNITYEGSKTSLLNFRGYEQINYNFSLESTLNDSVFIFFDDELSGEDINCEYYFNVDGVSETGSGLSSFLIDFTGNTGTAFAKIKATSSSHTVAKIKLHLGELTVVDVSELTDLNRIEFPYNDLTSIDISANISLEYLWLSDNNLTSIDVSNNSNINFLAIKNNNLTSTAKDNVYIDLDSNGESGGTLSIDSGRTSASDIARANLILKSWTIDD